MILVEKAIDQRKILNLIGAPISPSLRKPAGSPGLFLKSFVNFSNPLEILKLNSKCNFEKRAFGLLLHTNISNKQTVVLIPKESIVLIKLLRGKEEVTPFLLSPFWFLLKFKVPLKYARYFQIRVSEYSIGEMELEIETKNYHLRFIQNGYLFERHLAFFEGLDYENKFIMLYKSSS